MDDLTGLDWVASNSQPANKPSITTSTNYYPALRPTPPVSGRSTPSISQAASNKAGTGFSIPSKASTPANDSFADLVSFNSSQSLKNLSLQERQRSLQEQREKQELERRQQLDAHFGSQKPVGWNKAGEGRATTGKVGSPPVYTGTNEYGGQRLSAAINKPFTAISPGLTSGASRKQSESEDDILAAFDAAAPVDTSSNFPVPPQERKGDSIDDAYSNLKTLGYDGSSKSNGKPIGDDDDDPFGLGVMAPSKNSQPTIAESESNDDDVLGLLGQPVSQVPPTQDHNQPAIKPTSAATADPLDEAIAELVDMGFPVDKSRDALQNTESGVDVQAAVGWLLNRAHEESRQKPRISSPQRRNSGERKGRQSNLRSSRMDSSDNNGNVPLWMREQTRSNSRNRRENSTSPAYGERDPAKYAAELGNNLFKSANSLWKTGTKKLNQAVSEFNSDSDSSQPKWMREGQNKSRETKPSKPSQSDKVKERRGSSETAMPRDGQTLAASKITDEALMLESRDAAPRSHQRPQPPKRESNPANNLRFSKPDPSMILDQPRNVNLSRSQTREPSFMADPRSKLRQQAVEDQASQAYISPARRKKTAPKSTSSEMNTLPSESQRELPGLQPKAELISKLRSEDNHPISTQPPQVARKVPQISSISLQAATSHRQAGTAAFKLGNYAQATTSYTSSLASIPPTHPLTLVLLTNRALTHLKTGDPKACISDADAALAIIGPSRGQGESIDMGNEGTKDMTLYWGKAMTRKAEGLEQLERWNDALKTWKECVEAGVGGNTSIQGRNRCEKASGSNNLSNGTATRKPPSTLNRAPQRPNPKASALDDLSGRIPAKVVSSAEAVTRLRAANAKAERVDDEKFALADSVDERLNKWRSGKEGNLRALLGSLDTVLWEGSGWKKLGLSELVVPGKVKVAYMKGIAKVHPDKVCSLCVFEERWMFKEGG